MRLTRPSTATGATQHDQQARINTVICARFCVRVVTGLRARGLIPVVAHEIAGDPHAHQVKEMTHRFEQDGWEK
jgi:hypothetical protein